MRYRDVFDDERKIVLGRADDTNSFNVSAAALLCEEPLFINQRDDKRMGLYLIGSDELWLDVDKVEQRKLVQRKDEASVEEVAFRLANQMLIDEKTGEVLYRYLLDDGRVGEFSSSEVVAKRNELLNRSNRKRQTIYRVEEEEASEI